MASTYQARPTSSAAATSSSSSSVSSSKRTPSDFLKSILGRPVVIKLNSGIVYRGILACLDGYMNVALEQTEEYIDGTLKQKYGTCLSLSLSLSHAYSLLLSVSARP